MARGAKPGERRGGRSIGTPNKTTIEKALIAAQVVEDAQRTGKKLAKEVLEEFMMLFAGMAATYQPLPPGMPVPAGRKPDEKKFIQYAVLARDTAKDLAPFQSPTFRAVAVTVSPTGVPNGAPGANAKTINGKVVNLADQQAVGKIYQRVLSGGGRS